MEGERRPDTDVTQPERFKDYRHYYLRVNTQAATRLTMATFLAGLTFAAVAALVTLGSADASHLSDPQTVAIILLAVAAILFLLATISTYAAIQRLNDVSPHTLDLFKTDDAVSFPFEDGEDLRYAYNAYRETSFFIPAGLVLLLASMPVIGLHLRSPVGLVILIALIVGAILVPTSWMITFDVARRQKRAAKMDPEGLSRRPWRAG